MIPEKIAFLFFSSSLITLALVSVTILELTSGLLCLLGILDVIYNDSNLTGLIGLIVGSFALLVLLFGQRVSKNYDGAKTIAVYFILAVIGLSLA